MTGLVSILLQTMTAEERSLLKRVALGHAVSPQERETLERLRLIEMEAVTGHTKLSRVGLEITRRL